MFKKFVTIITHMHMKITFYYSQYANTREYQFMKTTLLP